MSLTETEMHDLGDRLVAAIVAGDVDAVRAIYAPDATIWHNFDQRDQTVDENLATLADLHVLTGDARGGPLAMPAMIRFAVADGCITRLEEYLDTRQAMVLYPSA